MLAGLQTSWRLTRGKGFPAQVPLCEAGKMYPEGGKSRKRTGMGGPWVWAALRCCGVAAVLQLER
jgi:hypothetical protein